MHETSHEMGVSAWYGSTLRLVFDGRLGIVGRRPTKSHCFIHENENMCWVKASSDRYFPQVKDLVFFVIHMCQMVKAH